MNEFIQVVGSFILAGILLYGLWQGTRRRRRRHERKQASAVRVIDKINTRNLRAPAPTPSHLRATVAIKGSFRGAEF